MARDYKHLAGITKPPLVPKTPARLKTNQEDLFCFHPDVILLTLSMNFVSAIRFSLLLCVFKLFGGSVNRLLHQSVSQGLNSSAALG